MDGPLVELTGVGALRREQVGGKAATLGELACLGLPVPAGFVVPADVAPVVDRYAEAVLAAADRCGPGPFAVRSSAAAEDLLDASYAGLYESVLDVPRSELVSAVSRVVAAAADPRVTAYRAPGPAAGEDAEGAPAIAVLVQRMIDASAAGVAFTADPLSGDRDVTVVTAVPGTGERLVGGEAVGEEWRLRDGRAHRTTTVGDSVLTETDVVAIGVMAERIAAHAGIPQDVEWALDRRRELHLLQARPMTALPDQVDWSAPGPSLWMRNFRLGEWLGEAMTPLFAGWLVPAMEDGFARGMRDTLGAALPYRYAAVNGWYFSAPVPSAASLARVVVQSRGRALWVLLAGIGLALRDPAGAHRLVLSRLASAWRDELLPAYRALVSAAELEVQQASDERVIAMVDELGGVSGRYLWSLAAVGGAAWKMESALVRFCRRTFESVPAVRSDPQVLLRGLPGGRPGPPPPHAVLSLDWHEPTAGELGAAITASDDRAVVRERHAALAVRRRDAERACLAALADHPVRRRRFIRMLRATQHYAALREEQAREMTLAWPVLRAAVRRLGQHVHDRGLAADAEDVFFLTRDEVAAALVADSPAPLAGVAARRAEVWRRQRRLAAPLTLGVAAGVVGNPMARIADAARDSRDLPDGAVVGHPASAGRATGPVRRVDGPADFAAVTAGDVLVASTTAPAFTPLFALAAAVVTDGGTLAAHASLIAREYGIPAVVGTGDATRRLRPGQLVLVDGGAGTVTPL